MRDDLISRSALLDEINGIYKRHYEKSHYQFIHDFFRAIFRRINKAPAVDAVEVVRCKDCKWYRGETHWCDMNSKDRAEHYNWYADDFCSYGEMRSND